MARVDERLNEVVADRGYTMPWSKTLDLVTALPGSSSGSPSSSSSGDESHTSQDSSNNNNNSLAARHSVFAPLVVLLVLFLAL